MGAGDGKLPPWQSGYCNTGHCEGTKPKSPSGKPIKTCPYWQDCDHSCHKNITAMFEMAGTPDHPRPIDNPEYVPVRIDFIMPERRMEEPEPILSSDVVTVFAEDIETPAAVPVPPVAPVSFAPTATGRAARGELEAWVLRETRAWLVEKELGNEHRDCTPAFLSETIGRVEGIKDPSVGAISAVFDRWVNLGFAVVEKKPTRFTGFTAEGIALGLDAMKDRAKRQGRLTAAAINRGEKRA